MRTVLQTDFSASRGNALQACFASIFEVPLSGVPNFIAAADYLVAIDAWLAPRNFAFVKVALSGAAADGAGRLEFPAGPAACILAGPSPRGDFKHAVVARVANGGRDVQAGARIPGTEFQLLHDPHPDATGLAGPPVWAGFFALRSEAPLS